MIMSLKDAIFIYYYKKDQFYDKITYNNNNKVTEIKVEIT